MARGQVRLTLSETCPGTGASTSTPEEAPASSGQGRPLLLKAKMQKVGAPNLPIQDESGFFPLRATLAPKSSKRFMEQGLAPSTAGISGKKCWQNRRADAAADTRYAPKIYDKEKWVALRSGAGRAARWFSRA